MTIDRSALRDIAECAINSYLYFGAEYDGDSERNTEAAMNSMNSMINQVLYKNASYADFVDDLRLIQKEYESTGDVDAARTVRRCIRSLGATIRRKKQEVKG